MLTITRRTTVTNVAGTTTTTFDAAGQVTSVTDPLGYVTTNSYDAAGRLTSTTDPESGTTSYSYDKLGNRTSLTDPVGNTTTWTYNDLGLMATDTIRTNTDSQGQSIYATRSYDYDPAGELTQYTDRDGRVTEYDYDLLGHKTSERWLDGSTVVNTLAWSYDAAGQLTSASSYSSLQSQVSNLQSFSYNLLGQLSTVTIANANAPAVVLIPSYDAHGNRKSLTALVDGVVTVSNTYTFDAIDQMLSVQQQGPNLTSKLVSFGYNALGQMTTINRATLDNGNASLVSSSLNEYDAAGRLSNLTYTSSSGSTQAAYSWTYDAGNRITTFIDLLHADQSATYNYDTTNQLTGADHTGTSLDESFNWDANGNPSGSQYVIGWNNQLLSDGSYQYTYDAEGNRTSKTEIASGTRTDYVWDYRNHLVEEIQHSSSGATLFDVRYGYDALNQRISRSTQDGVIEHFVYDGDHVLLDLTDPDGDGSAPATVSAVYLYGPSVDQLLSQENIGSSSNTDLWQLVDNLGSVRAIANNSGTVIADLAYDAFGAPPQATVDIIVGLHTRYLYTSRDFDSVTGEQFNRERYYDYHARRWLSNDPITDNGDPANWYRYGLNAPTIYVDPSGLVVTDEQLQSRAQKPADETTQDDTLPDFGWLKQRLSSYRTAFPRPGDPDWDTALDFNTNGLLGKINERTKARWKEGGDWYLESLTLTKAVTWGQMVPARKGNPLRNFYAGGYFGDLTVDYRVRLKGTLEYKRDNCIESADVDIALTSTAVLTTRLASKGSIVSFLALPAKLRMLRAAVIWGSLSPSAVEGARGLLDFIERSKRDTDSVLRTVPALGLDNLTPPPVINPFVRKRDITNGDAGGNKYNVTTINVTLSIPTSFD